VISTGTWVTVKWEFPEQSLWYGCPEGKVIEYDDTRKLYTVEHYDSEIPYRLYYGRKELVATLYEKLIFKAQNNKIIQRVLRKIRRK
jgi:predicted ATP-grasp superfamily ATP-dependent carboligase